MVVMRVWGRGKPSALEDKKAPGPQGGDDYISARMYLTLLTEGLKPGHLEYTRPWLIPSWEGEFHMHVLYKTGLIAKLLHVYDFSCSCLQNITQLSLWTIPSSLMEKGCEGHAMWYKTKNGPQKFIYLNAWSLLDRD